MTLEEAIEEVAGLKAAIRANCKVLDSQEIIKDFTDHEKLLLSQFIEQYEGRVAILEDHIAWRNYYSSAAKPHEESTP